MPRNSEPAAERLRASTVRRPLASPASAKPPDGLVVEPLERCRLGPALDATRLESLEGGARPESGRASRSEVELDRGAPWRGDVRSPARASRSGTMSAMPTIRPNDAICPICSEQVFY